MKIKKSPSKFSSGVSALWRGNDLFIINQFFLRTILGWKKYRNNDDVVENNSTLLFESARSAIAVTLLALGIGGGDEVIVSSFTCDAVTYAVCETGARVVYVDINDDLTMSEDSIALAITDRTKAIIVQNTFGRLGLQLSVISKLKKLGYLVIEDNCLSVGSSLDSVVFGSWGDVSVWSLEVSKTITIGWGGVLRINNPACINAITKYYDALPRVSRAQDIRRLFQLWFSVLMTKWAPVGGFLVWYFCYGTRLFRRSSTHDKSLEDTIMKLGASSNALYKFMLPWFDLIISKTHSNIEELEQYAIELGLKCPVRRKKGEYLVAPRFSILVELFNVEKVLLLADQLGVEAGRWFSECPPNYKQGNCLIVSASKAAEIAKQIINVPCHWSMTEAEIRLIKRFLFCISNDLKTDKSSSILK